MGKDVIIYLFSCLERHVRQAYSWVRSVAFAWRFWEEERKILGTWIQMDLGSIAETLNGVLPTSVDIYIYWYISSYAMKEESRTESVIL
jgi:hypothetical protein